MARAPTTTAALPPPERRMAFTATPKAFSPQPNRGEWTPIAGPGELQRVVETDSAAIARVFFDDKETHSLPDVWSTLEGFAHALFDSNHERHDPALREWRGLLACLALAGDFIPTLKLRRIDLAGEHPFLRVAAGLLPQLPILARQYNPGVQDKFSEIGSLHLRDDLPPLGLLVPTCLVCPAQSLAESLGDLAARIPWIAAGGVYDPTVRHEIATEPRAAPSRCAKEMTEAHYRTLADYLQGLLDFIGKISFRVLRPETIEEAADKRLGTLRNMLLLYQNAAKSAADAVCDQLGHSPTTFNMTEAHSISVPPFQDPLYSKQVLLRFAIARPLHGDGVGISDMRLRVRAAAADLFIDTVLADPDASLNGGKVRTVVWGQLTVQQMLDQPNAADNLQRDQGSHNRLILRPRDIFTDRLVRLAESGSAPGHSLGGQTTTGQLPSTSFVLPLTPLALLLFDRLVDVRNPRVRFQQRDGNRIVVTLTVDRLDRNGVVSPHQVTREYAPAMPDDGPGIVNRNAPPVLSFWPDLHSDDWKWFQIYSDSNTTEAPGETHHMLPLWPVSAGGLADIVRAAAVQRRQPEAQCALALVRNWDALRIADAASGRAAEVEIPVQKYYDKRLVQTQFRPEAYLIGAPARYAERGSVISADGFIMIPPPPPSKADGGKSVTVGVDFGSSNTTVFAKFAGDGDGGAPIPLAFGVRRINITEPPPPTNMTEFYAHFERPTPILTILTPRGLRNAANFSNIPGADAYVYPVGLIDRAIFEANAPTSPPMLFNIKWNMRDPEQAKRFLRHLALMSLAECADKGVPVTSAGAVDWRLSYPSAFTARHYDQFVNMFSLILSDLGFNLGPPAVATESVCAARYFQQHGMGAAGGTTIVLDIGGGTTDMAVWQQGQRTTPLVWQGSVLFAGRQLVVEPLAHDLATSGSSEDGEERATLLGMIAAGPPNEGQADFTASLSRLGGLRRSGLPPNGMPVPDVKWLDMVGLIVSSPHFSAQTSRMLMSAAAEEALERVIQAVEFGFAGILWFVGRQIHRLRITPVVAGAGQPALDPTMTGEIVICIGGRPSLLLRGLLAARHRTERRDARSQGEAFKQIFLTAAGYNPADRDAPFVRFDYSRVADAKREVAYGLLTDGSTILPSALIRDTILGEAGIQGGVRFDPDTFLGAPEVNQTQPVLPARDAPEIQAFLRCLREVGTRLQDRVTLPLWQPTPSQLSNAVLNAGNDLQQRFDDLHPPAADANAAAPPAQAGLTQEVQPPFFAVLYRLIREMIES